MSSDPETTLLRTPHQTKVIFQHNPHPPMTGIILLNANGSLMFDMKGVSGQEHRPYPIGLWHLVNVYRKLHGIQESLDPLKCLLVNSSDSCVCSIPTFLTLFPTRLEASLKHQAKLELVPKIPEDLRQAERQVLRRLTRGEVENVHFPNFEFPYQIRLAADGTFTFSGRSITEHVHLHSLEVLYFVKRHRIGQDDYSLPPISPLITPNQMYALDRMFFKDSAWDQTRSLGDRLSLLPTETVELEPVVPDSIKHEEVIQLKGVVTQSTRICVPASKGNIRAFLMPDGTFKYQLPVGCAWSINQTSWDILYAFKRDSILLSTPDYNIAELQPMIETDPNYALKHLYLETDPIQSLHAIIQDIYSDMPALEEVKPEALPNVVEAEPVCDGDDNCDCRYCSPISVLFEKVGLLNHQMGSTQRRLNALEQPTTNSTTNTVATNQTAQAILERLRQKETVLRAEIQIYKDLHQQIHINRQLEAELDKLKSAVGSP